MENLKPSQKLIDSIVNYFNENEAKLYLIRVNEWVKSESAIRNYVSGFMTPDFVFNIVTFNRDSGKYFMKFDWYKTTKRPIYRYEFEFTPSPTPKQP